MALTFKALSALLSYPTAELQGAIGEIYAVIRSEGLVDPAARLGLEPFLEDVEAADLFDIQERYVDLFDKTRRLSLHLFEHVHGESRDRGQAMVDLAAMYENDGMTLATSELPDYLPAFLEYLSTQPLDAARGHLDNIIPIVSGIEERLENRRSPYAAVFAALRSIAGAEAIAPRADQPAETENDDLAALDAAWEESAVVFGPGEALDGCSVDRMRMQVRAGLRDARRTVG